MTRFQFQNPRKIGAHILSYLAEEYIKFENNRYVFE